MKEKILLLLILVSMAIAPVLSDGSTTVSGTKYVMSQTNDNNLTLMHDDWPSDTLGSTSYSLALIAATTTGKYTQLTRGILIFDTSGIPDDQTPYSANLTFHSYGNSVATIPTATDWCIVEFIPGNYTSISVNDWNNFLDTAYYTHSAGGYTHTTYTISIDPSVINVDGYTGLGFMVDVDRSNTEPTWVSGGSTTLYLNEASSLEIKYAASVSVASEVTGDTDEGDTITMIDTVTGYTGEELINYQPELYLEDILYYWDNVTSSETVDSRDYYLNAPGNYSYRCYVNIDGDEYYSPFVNWTAAPYVAPVDYNYEVRVAGLDTDPISGALVELWYNGALKESDSTGSTGILYYDIPPYRTVNGTVSKSGYQNATFSQYINSWDTFSTVILYADDETPGSAEEYWTYAVTFRDANTHDTLDTVFITLYTDSDRMDEFLSEYRMDGIWTGLLPNDTTFYATASAVDYIDLEWSFTLNGASQSVYKDLIPVTYGSLQPVLNIFVYDTGGTALKDAGVTVASGTDTGFHLTNNTGYARHFCDNLAYGSSRNYTVTASKGGYNTESSTVNVSTQQPTVYIFMEKSTIATATPTGIYTPVATPIWSGDGGVPGNIKEQLINTLMTQFGVSQLEANILMGIILTILCAVVVGGALASYGSGSGAGVGAMIGAVVGFSGSSIIGFFPIWILIVVIVLVFAAWFMFRGRDE
jgi:hypothetical protein